MPGSAHGTIRRQNLRKGSVTETDDTRSAAGEVPVAPRSRLQRLMRYIPLVAPVLLWTVPCWVLLHTGQHWPLPVTLIGTTLFALGLIGMPLAMVRGHGRRQQDAAAIVGDTLLGSIWVLCTWSVLFGVLLRLALTVAGVGDGQDRARTVTWAVVGVAAVLLAWGYAEARRVPRVRRLDVRLPRLGAGLDGTRVVLITDTHYGPLDRARWSERVCATVNTLEADLVCHTGDIADGTAERRRAQAVPLGTVRATRARVYVTGNHEYYSEAQGWVDRAAAHGIDLQLSGHTHGGQIWPFHYLVRLDQPALAGLSRHGARTLLYTSRGTGFWGPPFRVFAPSEITLLVLRSPQRSG